MDGRPEVGASSGGTSTPGQPLAQPSPAAILWTDDLHADFVQAVEKCGGAFVARPKNIKSFMHSKTVTTTQIKSHLQRHRQRLLARTPTAADLLPGQAHATHASSSQQDLPLGRDLPGQLPGWLSGIGGEASAGGAAYKRMRPAPQLAASLGMLHSLLGQQRQAQAGGDPQQQQQQQQQFQQPSLPQAHYAQQRQQQWQGGGARWDNSSHATSTQQRPSAELQASGLMAQLPVVAAGQAAGGSGGDKGGRGRRGSEAPKAAMGLAWDGQAAGSAQGSAPSAAGSNLASWLAAFVPALMELQAGGGAASGPVPAHPGPAPAQERQAADPGAAAAAVATAAGAGTAGAGAGGPALLGGWGQPSAGAAGPHVGEGPTLTLLQGVAMLASEQYQVQQEIAEQMQALQLLHARLDSLSANMLELVSQHHAQHGQQDQQAVPASGQAVLASLLQLLPLLGAGAPASAHAGQGQGGGTGAGGWAPQQQQQRQQQQQQQQQPTEASSLWQQVRDLSALGLPATGAWPAQQQPPAETRVAQEAGLPLLDPQSLALLQQLVPQLASGGQQGGPAADEAPGQQQRPWQAQQQQQQQQVEGDRKEAGGSCTQQTQQGQGDHGNDCGLGGGADPGSSHTSPRAGQAPGEGQDPLSSDGGATASA